jgi:hypothetical protein
VAVEFDARFFKRELPFYGGLGGIMLGHANGDVGREFVQDGDTLVQALAGDGREFEFDHIEPGGVFGGVMHLKVGGQYAGLGGGQVLAENGVGMGVEVFFAPRRFFQPVGSGRPGPA